MDYIMQVVNKVIEVTQYAPDLGKNENVFQNFLNFNEILFSLSEDKHLEQILNQGFCQSNSERKKSVITSKRQIVDLFLGKKQM